MNWDFPIVAGVIDATQGCVLENAAAADVS